MGLWRFDSAPRVRAPSGVPGGVMQGRVSGLRNGGSPTFTALTNLFRYFINTLNWLALRKSIPGFH